MLKNEAIKKLELAKKMPVQRRRISLTLGNIKTYLTMLETHCIYCLYQGLSIKEAAVNLSLSKITINFYLTNILKKTRFNSIEELMALIKKIYSLEYFTVNSRGLSKDELNV